MGAGALAALVALSGCQSKPAVCGAPQGAESAVQSLAAGDTTFAVAFYPPAAALAGVGQNVILSPYSASAALTMLDVGAKGETDTQIQTVLSLPASGASVAPSYAALACADETDGSSHGNQLSIANSLWGQEGLSFQSSFLSVLADGYSAPLQQVDFENDAAGATRTIDGWVSDHTQGKIPTLFNPGDLDSSTRLVLVNAVYFSGVWATGFSPSSTTPRSFTLGDGTEVELPTMDGTVDLAQGSGQGFSVVELPYKGGAMVMDFLLPDGDLATLEASLTPAGLGAALDSVAGSRTFELFVPKFSFKTRVILNPVLAGLGMPDAFMPGTANLSGIDGREDLYVSVVVQQAFVEVEEQGTVAAAATGVAGDDLALGGGPSTPVLVIDRPFLFLVRDRSSGSLVFMGRVEDPRSSS